VDDDAVLDTGVRQIVFVDKGDGKLEPREVIVGERADGLVTIVKGLQAGEKVVTSGNFLVDSESRLKAALRQSSASVMGETGPQPAATGEKGESTSGRGAARETMPPMPGM